MVASDVTKETGKLGSGGGSFKIKPSQSGPNADVFTGPVDSTFLTGLLTEDSLITPAGVKTPPPKTFAPSPLRHSTTTSMIGGSAPELKGPYVHFGGRDPILERPVTRLSLLPSLSASEVTKNLKPPRAKTTPVPGTRNPLHSSTDSLGEALRRESKQEDDEEDPRLRNCVAWGYEGPKFFPGLYGPTPNSRLLPDPLEGSWSRRTSMQSAGSQDGPEDSELSLGEEDIDEEDKIIGLHLVSPVPSRPPSAAGPAKMLLYEMPRRIRGNKYKALTAQDWALGQIPKNEFQGEQILLVPGDAEQASCAGAPESPRALSKRITKHVDVNFDMSSWSRPATPEISRTASRPVNALTLLHRQRDRDNTLAPGPMFLPGDQKQGPGHMNLAHSKLGPRELSAVSLSLSQLKNLHTLLINDNSVDDHCVEMLVAGLRTTGVIRKLDLSSNNITHRGAARVATLLDTGSERGGNTDNFMSHLEFLNMSGNTIGDKGVMAIVKYLTTISSPLRKLNVSGCGVRERGGIAIGDALLENTSLVQLNISWNQLGVKGAQAIALGMKDHMSLTAVHLSHIGAQSVGAAHFFNALAENHKITTFDMSQNNITGAGAAVIAHSLKQRFANTGEALPDCNLSNNPIGRRGAERVLAVVAEGVVSNICLEGCSFCNVGPLMSIQETASRGTVYPADSEHIVDLKNPAGTYKMNLESPLDFQVAVDLVQLWEEQGPQSWTEVKLNGAPFTLKPDSGWPGRMPRSGKLQLKFVVGKSNPRGRPVGMTDKQFNNIWECTSGALGTYEWKTGFVRLLAGSVYLYTHQVRTIIASFDWNSEQVEGVMLLFGRLIDPENQKVIFNTISPESRQIIYNRLGPLRHFNAANPTGHYSMNLSRTVDRCIAEQLLGLYSVEEREGKCVRGRLQKCWRNVYINGQAINEEEISPATWAIPDTGSLNFDFVSYDMAQLPKEDAEALDIGALGAAQINEKKELPAGYKMLTDLRCECLCACLTLETTPDALELVEFSKLHFNKFFIAIWTEKWQKQKEKERKAKEDHERRRKLMQSAVDKTLEKEVAAMDLSAEMEERERAQAAEVAAAEARLAEAEAASDMMSQPDPGQGSVVAQIEKNASGKGIAEMGDSSTSVAPPGEAGGAAESESSGELRTGEVSGASTGTLEPSTSAEGGGEGDSAPAPVVTDGIKQLERGSMTGGVHIETKQRSRSRKAGATVFRAASRDLYAQSQVVLPEADLTGMQRVMNIQTLEAGSIPPASRENKIQDPETALAGLRMVALGYFVQCKHLRRWAELFEKEAHLAELLQAFYTRLVDPHKLPSLLRKLPPAAQNLIGTRISHLNIINFAMPYLDLDMHFTLKCVRKDECEVAKRLHKWAVKDNTIVSIRDLHINGIEMPKLPEDDSLWNVLSGHVMEGVQPTTVLEFNFFTSRVWAHSKAARSIQVMWRKHKAWQKKMDEEFDDKQSRKGRTPDITPKLTPRG